jgi:hypothetical protein
MNKSAFVYALLVAVLSMMDGSFSAPLPDPNRLFGENTKDPQGVSYLILSFSLTNFKYQPVVLDTWVV